jgi:hypothetical protein
MLTAACGLLIAGTVQVQAGGPAISRPTGGPYLWPGGGLAIPYDLDQGDLGPIPHDEAAAIVAAAFKVWEDVPTATATYSMRSTLAEDVDVTNYLPYILDFVPDGRSPVIFDSDGAIFNDFFGQGSLLLGLAQPIWYNAATGDIVEALAIINGDFASFGFPATDMLAIMVHEFGHYANLTHSTVNNQIARLGDQTGPTPHDTFPITPMPIETMSPRAFIGGAQESLERDDLGAFSALYPEPGYLEATGVIEGRIVSPDGVTPLTGVNVIARNLDDPFADALSALSSGSAGSLAPSNPLLGTWRITGLTPGARYAVFADEILDGGYSVPALSPLPGPEDFYNGAGESFDPATDDPAVFTAVEPVAGTPVSSLDIVLNRLLPGPFRLGNDTSQPLFLPFPFEFCGYAFDILHVNSNGNLSFGFPDTTPRVTPEELLATLPRIAPFFDDLNPTSLGEVSFDQTPDAISVRFAGVPVRRQRNSNTFEVTLFRDPPHFTIDYGLLEGTGGLAGYSCGGLLTSGRERETDLTRLARRRGTEVGRHEAAIWEEFTDADNDLDDTTLTFVSPLRVADREEPNSSLAEARPIGLPYNSEERFTEILPLGADADYFRFHARAGDLLIASTSAANLFMDTLLALYHADSGLLQATDDDGGFGVFSRLLYPVPVDGDYILAVSTVPDTDFSGDGAIPGRYVLEIRTTSEAVLLLEDDDAVEIPFPGFAFPYQGQVWDTVWLNSNGNLTFGSPDPWPIPATLRFLSGPPRISVMWLDLDPRAGGLVTTHEAPGTLTIRFEDVPQFLSTITHTFSVTLAEDGTITWRNERTPGGESLVGITEGGCPLDPEPFEGVCPFDLVPVSGDCRCVPPEMDVTSTEMLPGAGTAFEFFLGGEFDLQDATLTWPGQVVPIPPVRAGARAPVAAPGPPSHPARRPRR